MTPKSERSSWKYIAIGGGACLVCVVLGSAATIGFLRARNDVRAKAVVSASAEADRGAGATTSATGTPVDVQDFTLPEEPAMPAGTPAASLRKRPVWGKMDNNRSGNEVVTEYAPQLSRPDEVFSSATPLSGDLAERSFLICRAQTFAKADSFAGDDLQVRVAFGKTPLVVNDGPEDKNLGYVSAPLATLKKGDAVRFEVFDRDVWELEGIATPTVTWNGGALTVLDPGATIECRGLSGDALQKVVQVHTAEADREIHTLSTAKLTPTAADWGWPSMKILSAKRGVGDVAALTGWDDARTMHRVSSVDAAVVAIEAQRPAMFDTLHDKASDTVTVGMITASNPRLSCAPSGAGCTVQITLQNKAQKPLSFVTYEGLSIYTATSDTSPRTSTIMHGERTELAGGESMDLTITPEATQTLGASPSIMGICLAAQCQPLKLK
jgi:hypothetical protein